MENPTKLSKAFAKHVAEGDAEASKIYDWSCVMRIFS